MREIFRSGLVERAEGRALMHERLQLTVLSVRTEAVRDPHEQVRLLKKRAGFNPVLRLRNLAVGRVSYPDPLHSEKRPFHDKQSPSIFSVPSCTDVEFSRENPPHTEFSRPFT